MATDTITQLALVKNGELITEMRQKLARQKVRSGYRLCAALFALAALCGLALYGQSLHPKASVHKNADQHALDRLFKNLPR